MFKTVPATAPWLRGLWITVIVLSTVGLMIGFAYTAVQLFALRGEVEDEGEEEHANYFVLAIPLFLCVCIQFLSCQVFYGFPAQVIDIRHNHDGAYGAYLRETHSVNFH